MRRGRDGGEESEERDDADWLFGELAGDQDDAPDTDAPNTGALDAGEPGAPAAPTPAASFPPEAPQSAAPWSSRRERRDDSGDWFSLAEPAQRAPEPATGEPANEPSAADPAPSAADPAPSAPMPASPPGPVTPTAPFALTWGEGAPGAETPPARFTSPRTARRSFTAPFEDTSQPTPGQTPAEPAPPRPSAPVDDYGAALWSALTEPEEPSEPNASAGAAASAEPSAPQAAAAPETTAPGSSAPETSAPETPAPETSAPGASPADAEPDTGRPRQPFPAFASARWGDSAPPQPAAEPVADLLAASRDDRPAESTARVSDATGPVNGTDRIDGADGDDDTGAQPAFVWNLTPDPTAADPSVNDDRVGRAQKSHDAAAEPAEAIAAPAPVPASTPTETQAPVPPATPAQPAPDLAAGAGAGAPDLAATAVYGASADAAADVPARAAAAAMPTAAATPRTVATPVAGGLGGRGAPAAPTGPTGPTGPTASGPRPPAPPRGGGRRPVRLLLWIAGGLVVALVLAGLYFLGTQLAGDGDDAAPAPTPAPTAEPTPTPEPAGPQPAGVHAWDTLFGGECLDGFTSPWAEEFTVVDCAAPHAAQLVYRGELAEDAAAPFPGEAELGSRMTTLCTAPGVIDVGAASGVNDLQVQGAFPVTEEQWAEGERTYYCFVNRAGGEALTGSLQGPGPAA